MMRSKRAVHQDAKGWLPLRVANRGMCCAVGHDARSASAAIAARLNHFCETQFVSDGGLPIMGAPLYDVPVWGIARRRLMLRAVVAEAMRDHLTDMSRTAVVLLTPPGGSAGAPGSDLSWLLASSDDGDVKSSWHPASRVCPYGKGGIAEALQACAALLQAGHPQVQWVVLAASDSLLDAAMIEALLARTRVATKTNADGLIPGEGAAALLLSAQPASTSGESLWIESAAGTEDVWRIDGDEPMRAVALTQAMRQAAERVDLTVADLDFHASGMTGESWYAKETSMALSRALDRRKPEFPHEMIARAAGETGAASPVLTLAWLAECMADPMGGLGRAGLAHFAASEGRRSAMVVRMRA